MKIIVQCENFYSDKIYIQLTKNRIFPDENWYDFSVTLILDWLADIKKAEQKNTVDFRMDFMEGNCGLLCSKNSETVSIIILENDRAKEIVEYIDFSSLKTAIVKAAKKIVREAGEKGIWNDELERLKTELK